MDGHDVVIVGGGIVGAAIAWKLSRYNLSIALVEASPELAAVVSKANGGVIHAGYDPKPGSLKARLNVRGAFQYPRLAARLGFKFNRTGSLVVGLEDTDSNYIKSLFVNGQTNGIPDLQIIYSDTIRAIVPRVNPQARVALYAPSTGVVDPFEVTLAFAENALTNGVAIFRDCPVTGITRLPDGFVVHTSRGNFRARMVVNAAGLYADEVAAMVGQTDFVIKGRLGEVLVLDKELRTQIKPVLFPIPTPHSKGIIIIPTVSGNLLVSATARMVTDKENVATTAGGVAELLRGMHKLVPDLSSSQIIRQFSGIRAVVEAPYEDFVISPAPGVKGFINAAGIQSPGIAAAPAIAEIVRDLLEDQGLELKEKTDYKPYREVPVRMQELSAPEQERLIKANPAYGQVVCRCEGITAGEIIDSIRRPLGATTIDGVKRRTRTGMGRCQGGFCQSRVLAILAQEMGKEPGEIWLEYAGSPVVTGLLKGGITHAAKAF